MNFESVNSSNIQAIAYDADTKILEMVFNVRRLYRYFDVPLEVYQDLIAATSHGRYHNREIAYEFRYEYLGDFSKFYD